MGKFGVLKELNDMGIVLGDSRHYTDIIKSYTDFINGLGWVVSIHQLSNNEWCASGYVFVGDRVTASRHSSTFDDMAKALQDLSHKIVRGDNNVSDS